MFQIVVKKIMAGIGPKTERGVGGFSSLYKDNRKKVVVK